MEEFPQPLTLNEARKIRAETEAKMTALMNEFVLKTGSRIEGISLVRNPVLGQYEFLVKLDVKL